MSKTQIETFRPPSADDPALPEVVRRLVEVYHPLRIYLFGSAARGDASPDSDYDIMVVVPDDAPRGQQDCEIGYRALWGVGLAKDILVWTRASRWHPACDADYERGPGARRSWGNEGGNRATDAGHPPSPAPDLGYAHVLGMAKKDPALSIPVKADTPPAR